MERLINFLDPTGHYWAEWWIFPVDKQQNFTSNGWRRRRQRRWWWSRRAQKLKKKNSIYFAHHVYLMR